jgi:hypothetical protein
MKYVLYEVLRKSPLLLPRPYVESNFCAINYGSASMHGKLITHPIRIEIIPKYRRPNFWSYFHPLRLIPCLIMTNQDITPLWCFGTWDFGERRCAASTIRYQVNEEGTFSISIGFDTLVQFRIKPVCMFSELLLVVIFDYL